MKKYFALFLILQFFLDVSSLNLILDRDMKQISKSKFFFCQNSLIDTFFQLNFFVYKLKVTCRHNLCGKNGFCEVKSGEEVCICKAGFIGKQCQLNDPCSSKYAACNNNGECYSIIQLVNNVEEANFYCHCRAGYSGRNCESNRFFLQKLFMRKNFQNITLTLY